MTRQTWADLGGGIQVREMPDGVSVTVRVSIDSPVTDVHICRALFSANGETWRMVGEWIVDGGFSIGVFQVVT